MNEGKISVRYAKALFTLAKEKNLHKQVRKDMEYLLELIEGVPEFNILMDDPVLKPLKKMKILNSIIKGHIQEVTYSFIELVVKNNRLHYLDSIARIYLDLFKKDLGIKPATLITSVPIDEELRHTLLRIIEKRLNIKIELEEKTDPGLIGGFILKIGNQQFDASIAYQLETIKKELSS
ncbi:MAG: ATP synthase F1 subunit delta [Bacteroidales bacterium]|nr:ATP synthase F1 subunit delta [Bacteroidales bacterium]